MKLPISDIKPNPKNPRFIKDNRFKQLVKSLQEFPEMADIREIVVNKDHVILGGNMRYKAMQACRWTEVPVKVVDWSQAKQDEFVIKDNASFGEWDWDELANSWGDSNLSDWGIDLPSDWNSEDISLSTPPESTSELSTIVVVAYDDINDLDAITELYNLETVDMPQSVKDELTSQRKVYVFKK